LLLEDQGICVGDHVVVHLGYAIRKLSAEEARAAWELYDQILAASSVPPGA
jgi:hydrogenase expression/formation protein HypC